MGGPVPTRGEVLIAVARAIRLIKSVVSLLCLMLSCVWVAWATLHLLLGATLLGCVCGQLAGLELRWWWYPCVEDEGISGRHRHRYCRLERLVEGIPILVG